VLEELQKAHPELEQAPPATTTPAPSSDTVAAGAASDTESLQQAMGDLENINAHLFSIEALMERIFDVRVPEEVEQKFREVAGELAPDPLNADRLRLNRLLHQTPDLPDRG